MVTGIPGAGKTSVLSVVARAEAAENRLVLALTCHASDRDLAFGMLVDLLSVAPDAAEVLDLVVPTADPAGRCRTHSGSGWRCWPGWSVSARSARSS